MRNVLNNKIARRPTIYQIKHLYIRYLKLYNLWAEKKSPEVSVPQIFVCYNSWKHFKKWKQKQIFIQCPQLWLSSGFHILFWLFVQRNNKIFFHSYIGHQTTISCTSKFHSKIHNPRSGARKWDFRRSPIWTNATVKFKNRHLSNCRQTFFRKIIWKLCIL